MLNVRFSISLGYFIFALFLSLYIYFTKFLAFPHGFPSIDKGKSLGGIRGKSEQSLAQTITDKTKKLAKQRMREHQEELTYKMDDGGTATVT